MGITGKLKFSFALNALPHLILRDPKLVPYTSNAVMLVRACNLFFINSIDSWIDWFFVSLNFVAALDISTGPLARRTFQTAGPVRASTFHLSLARTDHLDICRASRFQIVLARTMTNHSMYFSRGSPPHISAVFAQSFCYSETPAWRESGMSIKHTDVSV